VPLDLPYSVEDKLERWVIVRGVMLSLFGVVQPCGQNGNVRDGRGAVGDVKVLIVGCLANREMGIGQFLTC
jgi:hypothetical protein